MGRAKRFATMIAIRLYSALLCIVYGTIVYAYALKFFRHGVGARPRLLRAGLVFAIVAHLALFGLLTVRFRHPPMANAFEALSALAFGLTFAYFLIEWLTGERNMGMWILAFPFMFQTIATFGIGARLESPGLPRTSLLEVHIAAALIGYCAFALSAAFSLMYLLLYRELKKRQLGVVFERLPSLDTLERMGYRSVHFGLGFLIVAVGIGVAMLAGFSREWGVGDPKIVVASISIVLYAAAIALRQRLAIRGKRFALVSMAGFGLVLFSLLVVDRFLPGFHRF
ncbi:cytochrome c biogenesis protein CcsA [Candidatus Sumerlaeota bacterium]|nr:cytochrome c biogenesis protein CcsA [Candidatus Sumerlaeota bacterium]